VDQPTAAYPPGQYYQQPYQTGPYPTEYLAGGPGFPGAATPKRRRGLWIGIAAGSVVAIAGASVAAYALLSGGGTTLDKQVPADVVAYAEVNLDPPAGQKVAALRFLSHFPDLKVNESAGDLVDGLLEPLFGNPDDRQRFVRNVRPWLGKHAAVAADPQRGRIRPVFVVEATDTGKARDGLARLKQDMSFGYVVGNKTVVVAETQEIAQQAATDAAASSLSGSSTYRDDVKAVGGDEGVLTAWADVEHGLRYVPGTGNATIDLIKGARVAASLRFTDTTADLLVKAFGQQQAATRAPLGSRLASLPDDTVAALGASGGDTLITQAYEQLRQAGLQDVLDNLANELNLTLPDDIVTLVGSQTVMAVGGTPDTPAFGVIAKSDNPSRAAEVAQKLADKLGAPGTISSQQTSDGTVLASSTEYASKLAAAGELGNTARFQAAMPDLASARFAIYVDVGKVAELSGTPLPAAAKALQAVGLTVTTQGDTATLHARLVVG